MIVVVKKCKNCPFLTSVDDNIWCNISTPKGRPVRLDEDRPTFCPLRKEQVIVREFA